MSELLRQSVEDALVPQLSYAPDKTAATYITKRRSCTYHASGSNEYSTTGTKVVRFNITGENQWLDPSTIRIAFDLNNTSTTVALHPLAPHSFYRRMRLLSRGSLLEEIDNSNRVSEMVSILKSRWGNKNAEIEGATLSAGPDSLESVAVGSVSASLVGIPASSSETLLFRPIFGLFNQHRYLPLKWLPLQIELELVTSALEPIFVTQTADFTANSITWNISNCQVKADLVEIDNGLLEHYIAHFQKRDPVTGASGNIKIPYTTYTSQQQSVSGANLSINITRAVSFLKRVYVSFIHSVSPIAVVDPAKTYNISAFYKHDWNTFYNTMMHLNPPTAGVGGIYQKALDLSSFQLQIGNELYPEYPISNSKEAFYQLSKTLPLDDRINAYNSNHHLHGIGITSKQYFSNKFIIGIDTETIHDAAFASKSLKKGDLITVKATLPTAANRADGSNVSAILPEYMHIVMVHENVITISDLGVTVYE